MKKTVFLFFLGALSLASMAQKVIPCGSVEYLNELDALYPGLKQHADSLYHESAVAVKKQYLFKTPPVDTLYEIPVVFHVLYNKPQENLHDSFLISQLEVLNACYNRENEDTVNTRDVFKSVAGNARIRFRFADKDPQGNPSNGIDRVYTNMTSFYNGNGTVSNDFVKSSSAGGTASWNSEEYLNIWVCNMTYLGQVLLLGYAFPPTNASGWNSTSYVPKYRQGVVLHYATVGRNNPYMPSNSINTAEKTAVHEVGHFLGLRHVWGDGNVSTGCFVDDFIDDTPISASASNGTICELSKNTCNTSNDLPDQIENYMDYSNGSCTNMFTKQQVALMRYNLHYLRFPISDIT